MYQIEIRNEQQLNATVQQLCSAADSVVIISQQDMSEAADLVKLIKTRHKEIDEERTALVKPFNDGVKALNARFKTILSPLENAESAVKQRMLTFQQEENRKAEQARREAEAKAAELARIAAEQAAESERPPMPKNPVVVPMPVAPSQTVRGAYGSVSTMKKVWAFEVEDIATLAAARPDLVTVDSAKVNAEIRGKGGNIPGLRVFERELIAVR